MSRRETRRHGVKGRIRTSRIFFFCGTSRGRPTASDGVLLFFKSIFSTKSVKCCRACRVRQIPFIRSPRQIDRRVVVSMLFVSRIIRSLVCWRHGQSF